MGEKVDKGDKVSIHYSGRLENDMVFDTTEGKDPFQFDAGSPEVIKGVSDAVIGMAVGDKKTVEVHPEDAYGEYDERLVLEAPKEKIPENVKEGAVLSNPETGQTWIVRELKDDTAVLDGNHVLAGKKLIFDIELVAVE
ncbi:MAG: FKBP-type peptidyl-prolyl cis-trans isomerase [Candidatus Nitrospinota bacterium M3_3B_026]